MKNEVDYKSPMEQKLDELATQFDETITWLLKRVYVYELPETKIKQQAPKYRMRYQQKINNYLNKIEQAKNVKLSEHTDNSKSKQQSGDINKHAKKQ